MYQTEKIAILLATYNGEKYISEQIESILEQSYEDWVLYIHDDGSKDNTVNIIKDYEQKYPNRVMVVDGPSTGGAKTNFLYLFAQVEAPYYMCCDQDDIWLPEKIALTKKEMDNLSRADEEHPCLVFTELKVVDGELNVLSEKMSVYQGLDCRTLRFNRALIQNVVTGCTMMTNRALRDELCKITDAKDVLMHDWWALLVATRFGKVSYIDTATILYRQHGNNGVGATNAASFLYKLKRMLQGADIKQSLENTRRQAKAFVSLYKEEKDTLASQYADIASLSKLKRLDFYNKNDVKKSTTAKNIGLMIWGQYMIREIWRDKDIRSFFIVAMIIGVAMSFLISPWQIPDEDNHLTHIAGSLQFIDGVDKITDSLGMDRGRVEYNVYEKVDMKQWLSAMTKEPSYDRSEMLPHGISHYALYYVPAMVGMLIAVFLHLPTKAHHR